MKVYIAVEGLERLALGRSLYTWDYLVRDDSDPPPEHSRYAGSFEVTLPTPADCVAPVMAKLKEREQTIQLEAQRDVMEIQERRMNLQAIALEVTT